jgi:hypothetical protein
VIYLFHGSDEARTRAKAFAWIEKAREKDPNVSYVRLSREALTVGALDDVQSSGGLFARRLLALIDTPYDEKKPGKEGDGEEGGASEAASGLLTDARLDALAASDNAIVLLAPGLSAAQAKKIVPKAKIEYKTDAPARVGARGFNSALVNALAARSREKVWLEVVRALRAGDAPEMVHGLLHWKARDLMEKKSVAWPPARARALSLGLILLLQESRRGGPPLAEQLERWALSI